MTMNTNIKLLKAGFTIIRRQEYPTICIKKCEYKNGSLVWTMLEKNFESIAARERRMKELLKESKFIDEPGEHNSYLESYEYIITSLKKLPELQILEKNPPIHSCETLFECMLTIDIHVFEPEKDFKKIDECINWAIEELKKNCFESKTMTVQIYEKTEQKTIPIKKEMKS